MLHFRVPAPAALALLVFQAVVVVLFIGWHSHITPPTSDSNTAPGGKVHVLLVSSWRSGSSFMGQVFNHHPSVFYLMEPAWHVWGCLQRPGARSLRMAVRDLIHRVFLCDLSVLDAYLPIQHNVSDLFMWSHSQALCSPPACPPPFHSHTTPQITDCAKQCNVAGLERAEAACHTYTHVVLKEVRFFELESLFPLLRDPSINLRILHLVRDPRAVFRSREQAAAALQRDATIVLDGKAASSDTQTRVMQEICRSHIRIYDTAVKKAPDFLQGRYKLVRYEDVVRDPLTEIQRMYDFVGLEMTEALQEWIHNITHGKGKGTPSEAFKITKRNASEVSQAWRTSLTFSKVQQVQEVCRSAMSLLGYRLLNTEAEQKQLDLDLTRVEKYSFTWLTSKSPKD
ncbi:carbohydrate sulfotransferase 6 isoform 1-T2 [Clarias gariepinus]|uniref:carbohydrate sulfotransferase 6 n=1 Tax=Clarias gariepinus TaxID=13013 RepID=UPI00234CD8E3|nr:carbohydrate sulfotransferase 6 [Clarias gariepinus]XP_053361056.1 carbohydrate sulfotransferase 6 [Clarias gariepinus]